MDGRPLRMFFLALMGCWMAFPLFQINVLAEDAIPFIASARVDPSAPGSLYGEGPAKETTPAIRDAGCQLKPAGVDCVKYGFPFLGPPQIIPPMKVVSAFGDEGSLFLMRLVSVGGMVAGMLVLWDRLAKKDQTVQKALLITATVLTPFTYITATIGQNASLMFLSACIGLSATKKQSGAIAAAATWVATVLFKLFPIPLLVVAVLQRRWRFLAWCAGLLVALTVITAAIVPAFQYNEFVTASRALTASRVASPWNISVDSMINSFVSTWRGEGSLFYAGVLARVAIIGGLFWWKLRDSEPDLQWAYAWVAVIAIHPQIWWYYFIVLVPAIAYTVRSRGTAQWWFVPVSALVVLPLALVTDEATLRIYGPLLLLASAIGLPFLVKTSGPADRPQIASAA